MDIESIKNKIHLTAFRGNYSEFISKKSRWILAMVSIILLGYCSYLWYNYISNPGWNEERKQYYINTKRKEAVFDKNNFDVVIRGIEERKSEYQKNVENLPDIFGLK